MDQIITLGMDEEEARIVESEKLARQGCCLSPILFKLYTEYFTKHSVEGLGDFKTGKQAVLTMKLRYMARLIDLLELDAAMERKLRCKN